MPGACDRRATPRGGRPRRPGWRHYFFPGPKLRTRAETKLQSRKDSVVPSWKRVVWAEAEPPQLFRRGADPCRVVPPVEVSGDRQTGLGLRGADEFEHLLIAVQGFAGPVLRDLGEEAMFDRSPRIRLAGGSY